MWLEYFEQYLENVFPRFLEEKPWNYKDDMPRATNAGWSR